ncbi:hypothetical protein GUITHDRAFT_119412 [Guillardia theta CCMP2712]|uniref:Uncharacterized protein n=1 Tax=Guillardia theta (strain CCMP2712) TaxID=905079 RepID=L1IEY4_GUITC|nr:hypothetical protein GUITHDRAFT_119412 [Guillardia theta CCMP2712]EKX34410.1 hypothetical protein GUITHDRAFT_119412 [Guillardia theta CCMP2712]|eukprot:XP_005821390.1 hypothetical protein GUITHDRAFT_119412 [Guillardia theta CCMP2712]
MSYNTRQAASKQISDHQLLDNDWQFLGDADDLEHDRILLPPIKNLPKLDTARQTPQKNVLTRVRAVRYALEPALDLLDEVLVNIASLRQSSGNYPGLPLRGSSRTVIFHQHLQLLPGGLEFANDSVIRRRFVAGVLAEYGIALDTTAQSRKDTKIRQLHAITAMFPGGPEARTRLDMRKGSRGETPARTAGAEGGIHPRTDKQARLLGRAVPAVATVGSAQRAAALTAGSEDKKWKESVPSHREMMTSRFK